VVRLILALVALAGCVEIVGARAAPRIEVLHSPNDRLTFELRADGIDLQYRVTRDSVRVIEWSPLGIVVDGVNLSEAAAFGSGGAFVDGWPAFDGDTYGIVGQLYRTPLGPRCRKP